MPLSVRLSKSKSAGSTPASPAPPSSLSSVSGDATPGTTDATSRSPSSPSMPPGPRRVIFEEPEQHCKPPPPPQLTPQQRSMLNSMISHFQAIDDDPAHPGFPVSGIHRAGSGEKRRLTDWEKMRLFSRESMLRYLRATKWNLDEAKKRLVSTVVWRREYGVDERKPEDVEVEGETGKETVIGFDNMRRPLHYMHPHSQNTEESPRQMQFAVFILERCIDMQPPGVEQLALLINFENKARNPTSISNAKMMLYVLQNHYVERLGVALCIRVPWVFKGFWTVISPFIDPVTRSKCLFDDDIKDAVPPNQLDKEFGGELDFEYVHAEYWPSLIDACDRRRAAMLERFLSPKCGARVGASEWIIKGGEPEDEHVTALRCDVDVDDVVSADANGKEEGSEARETETETSSAGRAPLLTVPGAGAGGAESTSASELEKFVTPAETPGDLMGLVDGVMSEQAKGQPTRAGVEEAKIDDGRSGEAQP